MSSKKSVLLFGVYLTILGSLLLFIPNLVLPLFGLDTVDDVWIRVLGSTFILISTIYYLAVREDFTSFYALTVFIRLSVFAVFIALYICDLAPLPLLFFGLFDAITAAWTGFLIKQENEAVVLPS